MSLRTVMITIFSEPYFLHTAPSNGFSAKKWNKTYCDKASLYCSRLLRISESAISVKEREGLRNNFFRDSNPTFRIEGKLLICVIW